LYKIALRHFSEALRKLDQVLDITPDDPYASRTGFKSDRGGGEY
jgi:regulator of sirC expression with transglutaminase-like and TPR domain